MDAVKPRVAHNISATRVVDGAHTRTVRSLRRVSKSSIVDDAELLDKTWSIRALDVSVNTSPPIRTLLFRRLRARCRFSVDVARTLVHAFESVAASKNLAQMPHTIVPFISISIDATLVVVSQTKSKILLPDICATYAEVDRFPTPDGPDKTIPFEVDVDPPFSY